MITFVTINKLFKLDVFFPPPVLKHACTLSVCKDPKIRFPAVVLLPLDCRSVCFSKSCKRKPFISSGTVFFSLLASVNV